MGRAGVGVDVVIRIGKRNSSHCFTCIPLLSPFYWKPVLWIVIRSDSCGHFSDGSLACILLTYAILLVGDGWWIAGRSGLVVWVLWRMGSVDRLGSVEWTFALAMEMKMSLWPLCSVL